MATEEFDRIFYPDAVAGDYISYNREGVRVRFRTPQQRQTWWQDYCKLAESNSVTEHLGEMPGSYAPIVVSLTVHIEPTNRVELAYGSSFIETMVLGAQTAISEVLGEEVAEGFHLIAAVLESGKYRTGDLDTINIRIQFPLCRMHSADQKRFIRPRLLDIYSKENLLSMLTVRSLDKITDALQSDVIDENYPLYGSSPNPGVVPAKPEVTFYDEKGTLQLDYDNIKAHLYPHNHPDLIRSDINFSGKPWQAWLPIILSIRYEGGETYAPKIVEEEGDGQFDEEAYANGAVETEEQQIARQMLEMISASRYNLAIYNVRIGKALANVFGENPEGLKLWKLHGLGSGSTLYTEQQYDALYSRFTVKNYFSELLLQAYAQEDSPRAYKTWYNNKLFELIEMAIRSMTDFAISRAVYHMTCLEYTYVVGLKRAGTWYHHNGAYLEAIKVDMFDLTQFRTALQLYNQQLGKATFTMMRDQQREQEALQRNTFKLIQETDGVKRASSVTRALRMIYGRKTSKIVMNEDCNLFALARYFVFESYDGGDGYALRRGILEDFVTFHSFVAYRKDLYEGHPDVVEYDKFEMRLYGDKAKADYMTRKKSKDMRGANREKTIEICLGRPHTGKTTDAEVDKYVFGTLQFGGSTTMITGKRGESSAPTPDLAHTNYMRRVRMEDPETTYNSGRMNEGWLCQESGNSSRHSRFLNDDGEEVQATASVCIGANDGPLLSPSEQLKVRVVIIGYPNQNLTPDEAMEKKLTIPETEEEQFKAKVFPKMNLSKETLIKYAEIRLWRMIKVHGSIDWTKNIPRPASILKDTRDYWYNTDPYHKFCRHCVMPNNDPTIRLNVTAFYEAFKRENWKYSHSSKNPDLNDFKRCIRGILDYPQLDEETGDEYYSNYMLYNKKMEDFINETVVAATTPDAKIGLSVLYDEYKRWCVAADIKRYGDRYEFLDYMKCMLGGYNKDDNAFVGITLRR